MAAADASAGEEEDGLSSLPSLRALHRLSLEVLTTPVMQHGMQHLLSTAAALLDCASVSLFTLDREEDVSPPPRARVTASSTPHMEGITVALTHGAVQAAIASHRPICMADARSDSECESSVGSATSAVSGTCVGMHVKINGVLSGAVLALQKNLNPSRASGASSTPPDAATQELNFTSHDEHIVEVVAALAGSLLSKSASHDALLQLSKRLSVAADLDSVARLLCLHLKSLLQVDSVGLYLKSNDGLRVLRVDPVSHELEQHTCTSTEGMVGAVFKSSATVTGGRSHPCFLPGVDELGLPATFQVASMLATPILDSARLQLAVLQLVVGSGGSSRASLPSRFRSTPVRLESTRPWSSSRSVQVVDDAFKSCLGVLEPLLPLLSLSLHRALLSKSVTVSRRVSNALLSIVHASSRDKSFFSLADRVIAAAYSATCADRISLFLVDAPRRELLCAVSRDVEGWRISVNTGVVGVVARGGGIVSLSHAYSDDAFDATMDAHTGYRTHSLLCVPVCDSKGRVLAVLQALNKRSGHAARRSVQVHPDAPPAVLLGTSGSTTDGSDGAPMSTGARSSGGISVVAKPVPVSAADTPTAPAAAVASSSATASTAAEAFDADDVDVLRACALELASVLRRKPMEMIILQGEALVRGRRSRLSMTMLPGGGGDAPPPLSSPPSARRSLGDGSRTHRDRKRSHRDVLHRGEGSPRTPGGTRSARTMPTVVVDNSSGGEAAPASPAAFGAGGEAARGVIMPHLELGRSATLSTVSKTTATTHSEASGSYTGTHSSPLVSPLASAFPMAPVTAQAPPPPARYSLREVQAAAVPTSLGERRGYVIPAPTLLRVPAPPPVPAGGTATTAASSGAAPPPPPRNSQTGAADATAPASPTSGAAYGRSLVDRKLMSFISDYTARGAQRQPSSARAPGSRLRSGSSMHRSGSGVSNRLEEDVGDDDDSVAAAAGAALGDVDAIDGAAEDSDDAAAEAVRALDEASVPQIIKWQMRQYARDGGAHSVEPTFDYNAPYTLSSSFDSGRDGSGSVDVPMQPARPATASAVLGRDRSQRARASAPPSMLFQLGRSASTGLIRHGTAAPMRTSPSGRVVGRPSIAWSSSTNRLHAHASGVDMAALAESSGADAGSSSAAVSSRDASPDDAAAARVPRGGSGAARATRSSLVSQASSAGTHGWSLAGLTETEEEGSMAAMHEEAEPPMDADNPNSHSGSSAGSGVPPMHRGSAARRGNSAVSTLATTRVTPTGGSDLSSRSAHDDDDVDDISPEHRVRSRRGERETHSTGRGSYDADTPNDRDSGSAGVRMIGDVRMSSFGSMGTHASGGSSAGGGTRPSSRGAAFMHSSVRVRKNATNLAEGDDVGSVSSAEDAHLFTGSPAALTPGYRHHHGRRGHASGGRSTPLAAAGSPSAQQPSPRLAEVPPAAEPVPARAPVLSAGRDSSSVATSTGTPASGPRRRRYTSVGDAEIGAEHVEDELDDSDDGNSPVGAAGRRRRMRRQKSSEAEAAGQRQDVRVNVDATGLQDDAELLRASTMVMSVPSVVPISSSVTGVVAVASDNATSGDAVHTPHARRASAPAPASTSSIDAGGGPVSNGGASASRHSMAGSFVTGRSSLQERMTARLHEARATADVTARHDASNSASSIPSSGSAAPASGSAESSVPRSRTSASGAPLLETVAGVSSDDGGSTTGASATGAEDTYDALVRQLDAEVQMVLSNDGDPLPSHKEWDFDAFLVGDDAFPAVVFSILHDCGVVGALRLDPQTLLRFADSARERYWPTNAFHNHFHGLHVCQAVSRLLCVTGAVAPDVLPPLEVFALLISGLCHDIDHPGTSNGFLSAIEDELAIRYNDQSVLENHHAALTCELMRDVDAGTDVVSALSPAQRRRVRQVVITSILGTDMSKHFGYCIPAVKALELPLCPRVDRDGKARNDASIMKDRDRLHEILLHTADLTGQVLDWPIAERWSEAIVTEFRSQASLEIATRVPITQHMHNINTPGECAELQSGFCDYVLAPLWRAMADVFPQLTDRVEQLESNSARYKQIIAAERSGDAAAGTTS